MAKTFPKKTGITNFDDCVYYLESQIESAAELPTVSASDNNKVLTVVSGSWAAAAVPTELPPLPEEDGTYYLQLVISSGTPALVWETEST